jgi:4-alpha-glucanotransferase
MPTGWMIMLFLSYCGGNTLENHGTNLSHLYEKKCVVYTGSHDNNTVRGWYINEIDDAIKKKLHQYLGRTVPENEIHWEMVRMAMMSVADTVIIPLQDLAGLGPGV